MRIIFASALVREVNQDADADDQTAPAISRPEAAALRATPRTNGSKVSTHSGMRHKLVSATTKKTTNSIGKAFYATVTQAPIR